VQAFQDKRLTLYWNPNLQSEKKKSGEIKFYNNDLAKSFNISVLGYDKENEQYIYLNENVTP
jgi:outer membrane cobalamin receptor